MAYTGKQAAAAAATTGLVSYALGAKDNKNVTEEVISETYTRQREEEQMAQKKKKSTMSAIFTVIMIC